MSSTRRKFGALLAGAALIMGLAVAPSAQADINDHIWVDGEEANGVFWGWAGNDELVIYGDDCIEAQAAIGIEWWEVNTGDDGHFELMVGQDYDYGWLDDAGNWEFYPGLRFGQGNYEFTFWCLYGWDGSGDLTDDDWYIWPTTDSPDIEIAVVDATLAIGTPLGQPMGFSGGGFLPDEDIDFWYSEGDGWWIIGDTTADEFGDFTGTVTLDADLACGTIVELEFWGYDSERWVGFELEVVCQGEEMPDLDTGV